MRVTASRVGLLPFCRYFASGRASWQDTSSPAAERGTRFHKAIANYIETGNMSVEWEEDIQAEMVHAVAWVERFGREKLAAEVAFAWNPATDRAWHLETEERDYGAAQDAGYLCGTADLVAIQRDTRAGYIGDWKTGSADSAGPQLRALAVMLARAEGLDMVTVEALEVTSSGVVHVGTEMLDSFALAAAAGELAEHLAEVETAEPTPGPHCGEMYCPARAKCPAGTEIIDQIVPAEALVKHRWDLTITSPDHAVWLLDRARLVEQAAKAVKEAVKAYVPDEGLLLADGSRLIEGTREMPRFDKNKAIALLKELGATDEQVGGCTYFYEESSGLRVVGGDRAKPKSRKKKASAEAAE